MSEEPNAIEGEISVDELVEFICASIANLGYLVGMGIRPNEKSMKTAALKLHQLVNASYSDGYADGHTAAVAGKSSAAMGG